MLTWEDTKGLLHLHPNQTPNVVVIKEYEFEEYKCDNCIKCGKVPADALLSAKWTCSDNTRDLERLLCSARQELTTKQLKDLIPFHLRGASNNSKAPKKNTER